jgi:hypothetical protein
VAGLALVQISKELHGRLSRIGYKCQLVGFGRASVRWTDGFSIARYLLHSVGSLGAVDKEMTTKHCDSAFESIRDVTTEQRQMGKQSQTALSLGAA